MEVRNMKMELFAAAALALLLPVSAAAQLVLGHRGGRHEQDENTLSAFQGAWSAGIHSFETDIRMSRDGKLVVSHDATLERMTTGTGVVEGMTEKELKAVVTRAGHPLLMLDDLLDFFRDKPGLYVEFEMKTGGSEAYPDEVIPEYCEKAYRALKAAMPADADWSMTSFDYRPLRYLRAHHPEVTTALITGQPVNDETLAAARALGVPRIAATLDGTTRAAVAKAHKEGLKVNLWPGTKIEDTMLALLLGADFCCTDIPIAVKRYIDEKHPELKVRF